MSLPTADEVFRALIALAKAPPPRRDGCKPRGRRLTFGEMAAMARGRKRAARRRQREATARARARRSKATRDRRARPVGKRMRDLLLLAMLPGGWHWRNEIVAAAGLPRHAKSVINQVLMPAGLIERVPDPDWTPDCYYGRRDRPWLYRLTLRGQIEQEAMALLQ